jgi:hypothetical protein
MPKEFKPGWTYIKSSGLKQEVAVKIIIGGKYIEVPQFIADAAEKPENGRRFHAFLKQVLAAQAEKVKQSENMAALEKMSNFLSGFK